MKELLTIIYGGGEEAVQAAQQIAGVSDIVPGNDVSQWIPVSERLPGDDCPVLLWCPPGDEDEDWLTRCDIGRYIRSFRDSHVFYTDDGTVIPTHWMPLPPPPAE